MNSPWACIGLFLVVAVQGISGNGCLYEGKMYSQGEKWSKPCQFNCVCDDGTTGHYTCTDICPTYDNLPAGCTMVKPPGEPCCAKPQCSFQTMAPGGAGSVITGGGSSCTGDKLQNCASYGAQVCTDSKYLQWVTENCCMFCRVGSGSGTGIITGGGTGVMTGGGTGTGVITGGGTGTGTGVITGGGTGTGTGVITGGGTGTGTGLIPGVGTGSGTMTGGCMGDKIQNCADYGANACTDPQYQQWAAENCCLFCRMGGGTGTGVITGGGTGTGTGVITGGGTGTGTGVIPGGGTGTGVITGGGTGTGTGVITGGGTGTGTGVITGGGTGTGTGIIPGGGTGTGTGVITGGNCAGDKVPNCSSYGANVCTDPQYAQWVAENCCLYCRTSGGTGTGTGIITGGGTGTGTGIIPGGGTGTGTGIITGGGTGTGTGIITGGGTGTGTGTITGGSCMGDKLQNCAAYGANICTDAQYQPWTAENCCMFCLTGGSGTGTGTGTGVITGGGTGTGTGTGSQGGGMTGSSSGCIYKGQVYSQGQQWNDGCTFKCTCTDSSTGQYRCQDPCYTFSLPLSCQMVGPAPGKCCKTPSCPSSVTIQYPPGYTEN